MEFVLIGSSGRSINGRIMFDAGCWWKLQSTFCPLETCL
jgi:hypothetical protein